MFGWLNLPRPERIIIPAPPNCSRNREYHRTRYKCLYPAKDASTKSTFGIDRTRLKEWSIERAMLMLLSSQHTCAYAYVNSCKEIRLPYRNLEPPPPLSFYFPFIGGTGLFPAKGLRYGWAVWDYSTRKVAANDHNHNPPNSAPTKHWAGVIPI